MRVNQTVRESNGTRIKRYANQMVRIKQIRNQMGLRRIKWYESTGSCIKRENPKRTMCRYKVYNVLMIVDFVAMKMEQHYQKRLQDFALNQNTAQFVWRSQLLRIAAYLMEQNVRQSRNAGFHLVPSSSDFSSVCRGMGVVEM